MVPVNLPDQTLATMNEMLVSNYRNERRGYLGASGIGTACERRIWNQFHWIDDDAMTARSIKAIEDGHYSEDVMAARLRLVPGLRLWTEGGDGKQFNFKDGHIRGNLDGKIKGIHRNPNDMHVWEHKCNNDKKFGVLVKLIVDNESTALFNWDETYFAQAQTYMHYLGIQWHYLTACSSGSRDEISCITAYDPAAAKHYIDRAREIIKADKPPPRISSKSSWYQCKMCPFTDNCHGDKMPLTNCRTCAYSTPLEDGSWKCELLNTLIDDEVQRSGCGKHLFNPSLVPGAQTDAGEDWVEYEMKNGTTIRNQNATVTTLSKTSG
jgi:hypothetical protein